MKCSGIVCAVVFSLAVSLSTQLVAAERPVDYSRDIKPILSNNCYKCHGPDEHERQASLRLDVQKEALAELESGAHAIVPGKSSESELLKRLVASNPDERMPPVASGKKLTPEQIDLVKRWIDQGAEFRGHWSFIPPKRVEPQAVKHEALVRNPIDRFILGRVEAEGLEPSAAADKITLLRRLTFDLTGLPPTPAEVDAYLADNTPDAYEKTVERLLASPRYGEHLGRYWLDAARYGDTHGLHFDNERSLWRYRDWVIGAFNQNKPFNQFTIEQLAGDLLPNATLDQRVATGFNRCNVSTSEGGSIDEEVLVRYGVDRVETTSTVWLGLTTGCAVCHDHKFDPITQKDFYQLFAYFSGVAEGAMDGNALAPPPIIKTPTPEQTAQQQALAAQVAAVEAQVVAELAKIQYVEPVTEVSPAPLAPQEFVWFDDELPAGAKPQPSAADWKFVSQPSPVFSGAKASTRTAKGVSQHFFTEAQQGLLVGEGDKFFAYVYIDPLDQPKAIMLQFNDGAWEHRACWGAPDAIPYGMENTPGRVVMGPLPEVGAWVRLEVEAAKVGLAPGAVVRGWAFTQNDGTIYWDKAGIVSRSPQAGQRFESQLLWEAFEKGQSKSQSPPPVIEAVKADPAKRSDAQKKLIHDYFLENVCGKTRAVFDPLHTQVADLKKKAAELDGAIPTTMVMAEMPKARDTFILVRGAYDKKGAKVEPGVPASLPPLPAGSPNTRLGLANWLVDPANPLTARVIVNRYWQHYFGVGIVKTAEDFGAQGAWPTHPELLDWLATEFIRTGWDIKQMQRLIVTSTTYRQASKVTADGLQRDPANELLARGPRFRLDAEQIRDSALAVSGLLVEQIGGRSVRPYQPEGVWEAVGFLGSNTSIFKADAGASLYRRSLYTFWKRTAPPPSLQTFDAPSRETCTVRRARTNTPLQALVLMNDKQYVEAARQLAARMMTEGGSTPEERLTFAFRLATGRRPAADELAVLSSLFAKQLEDYTAKKDEALKLLAVGDSPRKVELDASQQAAYAMMANLILNLDETVTKE